MPWLDQWYLRNRRDYDWFRTCARAPLTALGAIKLFAFLGGSTFLLASTGYFLLWMIMPEGWVFGALYRMFLYHWQHPIQYIGLMSLCYSIVGSLVILSPWDPVRQWPRLSTLSIVVLSIAIASPAGGVLWVIHDMQAGYFLTGERFWEKIGWGAMEGIYCGWLVILLSIPYNILGLFLGYFVTMHGYGMMLAAPTPPGKLATLAERGVVLPNRTRR